MYNITDVRHGHRVTNMQPRGLNWVVLQVIHFLIFLSKMHYCSFCDDSSFTTQEHMSIFKMLNNIVVSKGLCFSAVIR